MSGRRFLITGAAGFIGSNIVEQLVSRGETVVALDNLIAGKRENLAPWLNRIDFVEGDIRDLDLCRRLCRGIDFVLHQAALGSVPRSVDDPLTTHDHNVNGTLNVLLAAREAKVRRVVFAASSSAYGDTDVLPKVESMTPRPQSPYAVSKCVGEQYASVFSRVYGLPTVSLRYFNVFGPRQDPAGAYAAVIPRFIQAIRQGVAPVIFGDGEQTRDFTYVDNVVAANLRACEASSAADGLIFNIGVGSRISLNELTQRLLELLDSRLKPSYAPQRPGDVRHSLADIARAQSILGYRPVVDTSVGLEKTVAWHLQATRPLI